MSYDGKITKQTKDLLGKPAADLDKEVYEAAYDWATADSHGDLPARSARGFAMWLDEAWSDWTEDPEATVEDIFKGAVLDWCGGRVMPS